jgi:riboflavin synthase
VFTGLIEATGEISRVGKYENYQRLTVSSDMPVHELQIGESISCDGVCLTVVEIGKNSFSVDVSQESASCSIAAGYKIGALINLERALKLGDRLGGHQVSGHVDDVGRVKEIKQVGKSLELAVSFDKKYDALVIEKGSIAINGVSLTVNKTRPGNLAVNLIPHSAAITTLASLKRGARVNLEFDLVGKYIVKFNQLKESSGLTRQKLIESGW